MRIVRCKCVFMKAKQHLFSGRQKMGNSTNNRIVCGFGSPRQEQAACDDCHVPGGDIKPPSCNEKWKMVWTSEQVKVTQVSNGVYERFLDTCINTHV